MTAIQVAVALVIITAAGQVGYALREFERRRMVPAVKLLSDDDPVVQAYLEDLLWLEEHDQHCIVCMGDCRLEPPDPVTP